ncbi:MAG: helix-turn-helix domain-containing protein [Flavobacteriales bacterium]|jgi:AraC-like DNA-binding protein|nr:helix-turn-helix domain-containing protein [Flavobacteriales bacterium]
MSQAISIGLFLCILKKSRTNFSYLIGLFLVISGLSSLSEIYNTFNVSYGGVLMNSPFEFYWLIPSILFLYIERVSLLQNRSWSKYLLGPGFIEFIFDFVSLFLSEYLLNRLENSALFTFLDVLGTLYGFVLFIGILIMINKHNKLIKEQYSNIEKKELIWVRFILIFGLSSLTISILLGEFVGEILQEFIMVIFNLFITIWIAYNALFQEVSTNLFSLEGFNFTLEEEQVNKIKEPKKNNEEHQVVQKYTDIFIKIDRLIRHEELYLNPELSIVAISEKIKVHPRSVSKAINTNTQKNFNNYINDFRVQKAVEILKSREIETLNIEGIGQKAGFKSNSTFYAAFGKRLNTTPLRYLENLNSGK